MPKSLKILTIKDKNSEKLLRTKSLPVKESQFADKKFREFTDDLLYTAQHSQEQGNVEAGGISAVQVGELVRVFYSLNYDTDQWELFINPSVEPDGFLKITTEEGCLSIPNFTGDVTRYYKVKVRYQDINGKWVTKRYNDINAVSIQHEFDHLEGVLFTDRIDKKN
jgi:peptide deformylase